MHFDRLNPYCGYDGFERLSITCAHVPRLDFFVAARTQNASDIARVRSIDDELDVESRR